MKVAYEASPTRPRSRRTKAEIVHLRRQLAEIVSEQRPMTCCQVPYQAVSRGIIEKTERAYKSTICRLLAAMRCDRQMPYGWIQHVVDAMGGDR